jgi:MFS transporter, PPP family, 3-phenylpropionic acid transporter
MLVSGSVNQIAKTTPRPDRNPSVWTGSLYCLFYFLCAGSYMPFLYVHLSDQGLSGKQVGLLATLAPIMTVALSPLVASVADRRRIRVRVAQVGMVCVAVTMFMFRFPTKFGGLAALMVLLALFSTPFSSVGEGLIARMAHRNGFNYGAMRLWGSFGFAVTALICGFVWDRLGFKTMFLISAVLFVVPIIVIGFVEEGPVIPAQERRPARTLLLDRGLLLLLVGVVLSSIANSLSGTFSGIYVRSLGGSNLFVGAMWAISAMAELPTMFYSNRISDKIGETAALLSAYAVMGLSFLGYSLVRDPALLLVLCATKGMGYGLWLTATVRAVTRRTAEEWASTAQSMLTICLMGLAPLIAGPVGGLVHDAISPAAVFAVSAASLGAACVVVVFAWRLGGHNLRTARRRSM